VGDFPIKKPQNKKEKEKGNYQKTGPKESLQKNGLGELLLWEKKRKVGREKTGPY